MNTASSGGELIGFLGADHRSVQWLWGLLVKEEEVGSADMRVIRRRKYLTPLKGN